MYLFVGERPSLLAARIGATWQNGKLAARQLHDALRTCGLDPAAQQYTNLYSRPTAGVWDAADEAMAVMRIAEAWQTGLLVVGMGAIVCRRLDAWNIPHHRLIHPAARGAIRKKERYAAHVAAVLSDCDSNRDGGTFPPA